MLNCRYRQIRRATPGRPEPTVVGLCAANIGHPRLAANFERKRWHTHGRNFHVDDFDHLCRPRARCMEERLMGARGVTRSLCLVRTSLCICETSRWPTFFLANFVVYKILPTQVDSSQARDAISVEDGFMRQIRSHAQRRRFTRSGGVHDANHSPERRRWEMSDGSRDAALLSRI
jgi:hypothetical protein